MQRGVVHSVEIRLASVDDRGGDARVQVVANDRVYFECTMRVQSEQALEAVLSLVNIATRQAVLAALETT